MGERFLRCWTIKRKVPPVLSNADLRRSDKERDELVVVVVVAAGKGQQDKLNQK